ncbi:MAG: DNA ligase (NAD+), partial [Candidatus Azotimanducaceae bacterium]
MTAEQEIDELRQIIHAADVDYYIGGESRLTDAQYDEMFVKLRKLETDHPELVTD